MAAPGRFNPAHIPTQQRDATKCVAQTRRSLFGRFLTGRSWPFLVQKSCITMHQRSHRAVGGAAFSHRPTPNNPALADMKSTFTCFETPRHKAVQWARAGWRSDILSSPGHMMFPLREPNKKSSNRPACQLRGLPFLDNHLRLYRRWPRFIAA